MEYVIAAFLILTSAIVAISLNLIANELYDSTPSLSRWLIDRAISHFPETERERYREEWYSDNEHWPGGKLTKLFHAFGCVLGARTTAAAVSSKGPSALEVRTSMQLIHPQRQNQFIVKCGKVIVKYQLADKTIEILSIIADGSNREGELVKSAIEAIAKKFGNVDLETDKDED